MTGKMIGHYEIVEKIGEGGMGEVFRARDTTLGRDVALKFLPDSLAHDAERLGRFEREARLLAAFSHPNIASIYGFEQAEGRPFLVLEMIEGEDLAQRIARGPVPVDEAVGIALQVAEAMEAAHEEGIVHRDLKPANVVVSSDGRVKVLDFGLGKAWEGPSGASDLTRSPTVLSDSPTVAGVILGTAAYMSPEQARGRAVDKRADVFAFGCVLFEMLTGRQAFTGETVSDTLAAVLRAEPDWEALPEGTPRAVERLLRRCLEKNIRLRLRDIGEARIILERVRHGETDEPAVAAAGAAPARGGRSARVAWTVAAVAVIAALFPTVAALRHHEEPPRILRTSILPPANVRFQLLGIHPGPVAIAPDGKRLTFTGRRPDGASVLFVRALDAVDAKPLSGTEGAGYPFWSPDGRSIGFFANGKLKRVDASGGPPLTLCDATGGKGGSWNKDGVIVFAPSFNTGISRVSDAGGKPTPVTALSESTGTNSHRFPVFLPDGTHFLYFSRGSAEVGSVRAGSIAGNFDREIMKGNSNVAYANGYLLFMRQGTLMGRPFDPNALAFTGAAVPVADPVRFIPGAMYGIFDVSTDGLLVYQGGSSVPGTQIVWRDLTGKKIRTMGDVAQQDEIAASPDGKHISVDLFDNIGGTGDIWVYDTDRGVRTRFTFDPANDLTSIWSPQSDRIAFSSNRTGKTQIYVKSVLGVSDEKQLFSFPEDCYPADWTRDGRYLVFIAVDSASTSDVWAYPFTEDGKPFALLDTPFSEFNGAVSPDGHWLAYNSDESGRFEVYVTSFPKPGRKWQVSSEGGTGPMWDPKSTAIYYLQGNTFYAVETTETASSFAVGHSRALFESNTESSYAISPDGKQMVLLEDADEGEVIPLTLVTHWNDDLARREH